MVDLNPHQFSTQTTGVTFGQITDNTDFPHTGLIKALSLMAKGNMAVKGSATDFDITQATTGNVIQVAAGRIFKDNKLTAQVSAANFTSSAFNTTTGSSFYHLLVVDSSNVLQVRKHGSSTSDKIPEYTEGDTIIAVIMFNSSTAALGSMQIQFLTTSKFENSLSVGYSTGSSSGSVYTEAGSLTGSADGITMTGLYKLDTLPTATVAGADKVIIQDSNDSDKIKTVTATSIAALATGISNVVDDTSPQLGADLDTNSFNIKFDDAHGIYDDDNNEQMVFQKTASAVNYLDITNAATGNGPTIEAVGTDTDIDLNIKSKGTTSQVKVNDNMTLDNGYIQIGTQDSSLVVGGSGTSAGYDLLISAGSTSKGSNNLDGGDLILKSGGGDGTGTSVMTFFTKVDGTDDTAERMRIDTLGNLLIGSTGTSNTKLGVAGAVKATAYHTTIVEIVGGPPTAPTVTLNPAVHGTILTQTQFAGGPNALTLIMPNGAATLVGWSCKILCRNNAGGPDNLQLVTQGSDEIKDIAGAVVLADVSTPYSLTSNKAYELTYIDNNEFILYQIN